MVNGNMELIERKKKKKRYGAIYLTERTIYHFCIITLPECFFLANIISFVTTPNVIEQFS